MILADEHTITLNPLYNQALGGVKLHIFEKDTALVKTILEDPDVQIPIEDIKNSVAVCPKCGANNVGFVQPSKKRFGVFTIVVSFLMMVYPFYTEKVYHYFNCEHEF